MGLKWFRARLSIKKEASKVPIPTGLYRKVSYSGPNITQDRFGDSDRPRSFPNNPTANNDNNEKAQYNNSKIGLTDQLTSLVTDPPKCDDYTVQNTLPSTSIKDPNIEKELLARDEDSNKMSKSRNDIVSDTKDRICQDEIVI